MDHMTSGEFDEIDARLLDLIQREFPLVPRPFDALADRLGILAADVMDRISRLKSERVIRQISAIFDSSKLGYSSALVAFRACPEMLDRVAERVSLHSGVSHCYSRDAEFNLWFTITLSPDKNLKHEVEDLARIDGVQAHVILPALRIFKIGVFFEINADDPDCAKPKMCEAEPCSDRYVLNGIDRSAVRALQIDLPITGTPFTSLAGDVGMTEDELLSHAKLFLNTGVMRRFAAVLRHQCAGYVSNAMVCWQTNADRIEATGAIFAANPSVSHCYERAIFPDWPYPIYTMIHARSDEELQKIIADLSASSRIRDFRVLRSIREYKKSRVVYFD